MNRRATQSTLSHFIEKSEAYLLALTIIFQVTSLITLLRVATGIASPNVEQVPGGTVLVIPNSLNQTVTVPDATPQFQNPVGSGLDASFLTAILFVAANIVVISILAFLYRKRKMKWFSVIVSIFLVFNVTELYLSFLLGLYSIIPLAAAVGASILTVVSALYGLGKLTNLLAILLALELGSSFPVLLQAPLNWIIPAVYAFFDIYAIYYGRLGKLVVQVTSSEKTQKDTSGSKEGLRTQRATSTRLSRWPDFGLLTVNLGSIEIGMADIAFYSMVPAVALIIKNLFAFVVVMVAVDVGLILSFWVFRKKEIAPGLPIPILSGLIALLILSLFF